MTVPVTKRKRDWFRVIRTLNGLGVSAAQIARECGRDTGAVKHWSAGGEPKESDARIVLALLAKHDPEAYRAHQAEFDIRVDVEAVTHAGEQRRLSFVDLGG